MSTTDTSERALDALIVRAMVGRIDAPSPRPEVAETSAPVAGGTGWVLGDPSHYNREFCVDLVQLRGVFAATQPTTTFGRASVAGSAAQVEFSLTHPVGSHCATSRSRGGPGGNPGGGDGDD